MTSVDNIIFKWED